MPGHVADRNLLFGILAMQMDFITRDDLITGMNAWILEKHRPLGEILVERGALDFKLRELMEPMVQAHLARHGGDAARSLAALSSIHEVGSALRRSIDDPEVQATLASIPGSQKVDTYATRFDAPQESAPASLRYRKVRDHAKGGLGVVFVARDEELNREVALKEIQDRHADDPTSRARFLIEAEVTGGLEHPGIVPVYGLGSYEDGRPFYAMRFIRGDSLKDAIARFHADKALPRDPGAHALALQKLLRRFLDVCNAVGYAHSRGVLHRDLKPDNVMIGKYGETLVVDWGLAKTTGRPGHSTDPTLPEATLYPASASGSNETLPGSVLGTPAYMSPEQAAGRLDLLGPTSDVYSLGATLYTLLTGRAPVTGHDLGEVLRKVERGEFPRPLEASPWLDPALEAVCLKAMALLPDDRYSTPRALADEVDRWLAGEPVLCWKEPPARRMRRWVGRNRTLVTSTVSLMATAVVALGIGIVVVGEQSRLRGIAVHDKSVALGEKTVALAEAKASASAAEEALRKEARSAAAAKAEAQKVVGVIDVLVNTFRASDPIGLDGLGVRRSSEAVGELSAREILDRSAQIVENSLGDQPLVRATLMDTMGEVYRSRMEFEKADRMLRSALEVRTGSLERDHPDLATSLIHVGWLHQDRGQFDEAERCFRDAVRLRTAHYGADAQPTIDAKGRLAILWMLGEEDEKAAEAFREVIDKLGRIVGQDHHDVAIARLGLAAVYLNKNRMAEAYVETKRAMNILLSKADSEKFFLAIGKFQKGLGLGAVKLYGPAERLLREGMEIFRTFLGPHHPYLAFFHFEIGEIQQAQGKLIEAEKSFRDAMELVRRSVGFRHPKARLAVVGLGEVLEKLGRYEEAKKLFQELVEVRRAAFGRDHVWVADALVSSAFLANSHGDGSEYRRMSEEALVIYRKQSNREPAAFAECLNNVAQSRMDNGAAVEAEPLLREVLPLVRRKYGEKSSPVATVLSNLSRCLVKQGRDGEETDRLFEESIAIRRSPLDSEPESRASLLSELADSEQKRGLLDRAEAHAREALEVARPTFRNQPAGIGYYVGELARVIARRGDLKGAAPLFEEAETLYRSADPKQPTALVDMISMASLARAAEGNPAIGRESPANLLREIPKGDDPGLLNEVTWPLVRFAGAAVPPARLESMGRKLLAAKPGDPGSKITGAAALVRAGQFEEAALRLEELRRDSKNEYAFANFYLAIAYRKLDRLDLAEKARDRAIEAINRPREAPRSWDVTLSLQILGREVDELFRQPPGEWPSSVFAPDV